MLGSRPVISLFLFSLIFPLVTANPVPTARHVSVRQSQNQTQTFPGGVSDAQCTNFGCSQVQSFMANKTGVDLCTDEFTSLLTDCLECEAPLHNITREGLQATMDAFASTCSSEGHPVLHDNIPPFTNGARRMHMAPSLFGVAAMAICAAFT
ncbi:hypothetical protein DFH08DRAFT_890616 [Mycena albidolilacea]|uniref:Uncharacterized protein n=1 Tax=Mycena albidolilacea TaxID=1033008 RepID=A0AAD7EGG5_9AGAR|nr:hypothetical protein DFH08DRAFT_890616 [Mycena albidolilacea]